jgi:hypothetical protein
MGAAIALPPEYTWLEACAALGGRSMHGSPRGFSLYRKMLRYATGGVSGFLRCLYYSFLRDKWTA